MRVHDSFELYKKMCHEINHQNLDMIIDICKILKLPQKTISISHYNYFIVKEECQIEPDDPIMFSASIDLACKICETSRCINKILECSANSCRMEIDATLTNKYIEEIYNCEVDIAAVLDFNSEIAEIYNRLQQLCKQEKFDQIFSKRCWIYLNDIMLTPIPMYFTVLEIISSAIFLAFLANCQNSEDDFELYKIFFKEHNFEIPLWTAVEFICKEMLDIYQSK